MIGILGGEHTGLFSEKANMHSDLIEDDEYMSG